MKITILALAVVSLLVAVTRSTAMDDPEYAFTGVDVIPMTATKRVLADQVVVVRGDRIAAIGATSKIGLPSGVQRIDGRGKFLVPGLAEMHGHIPPPSAPEEFVEAVLFLYLANGVTTVRGMLGAPGQLDLRDKASRGDILAPTLYLAGPSFNGRSIESPEQAQQRVRQQSAEGWDLLKVHPGLTMAEYDAMARTANEVGIRFAGHVPQEVGLLHALEMGQETVDHLDGYIEYLQGDRGPVDRTRLMKIARRTKAAGAWVVPTMALWETLLGAASLEDLQAYPELRYMPRQQVDRWTSAFERRIGSPQFNPDAVGHMVDNRKRLLRALNEAGVRILLGTDAPQQFSVPGFSIHREVRVMADCGMSPYAILVSGTKNVGEYFKEEDSFGTIEVGRRADLILLDANPLEDISNLSRQAGVMIRGRWLPESEIQEKLKAIAR